MLVMRKYFLQCVLDAGPANCASIILSSPEVIDGSDGIAFAEDAGRRNERPLCEVVRTYVRSREGRYAYSNIQNVMEYWSYICSYVLNSQRTQDVT